MQFAPNVSLRADPHAFIADLKLNLEWNISKMKLDLKDREVYMEMAMNGVGPVPISPHIIVKIR